jgi:DNA primase
VLAAAAPLDAVIWDLETAGRPLDTPERIAGLEKRLETRALTITDHKVQYQYKEKFKQLMQPIIWPARVRATGPATGKAWDARGARRMPAPWRSRQPPESLARRQQQVLLAIAINHSEVLEKRTETFGSLEFFDPALDKLRQQILMIYAAMPDLDSHDLKRHLKDQGFEDVVATVLGPDVYMHAPFARPDRDVAAAGAGFDQVVFRLSGPDWQAERVAAEQAYTDDDTEENWVRLQRSIILENQNLENGSGLMEDGGAGAGRGVSSVRTGS